jgi:hypothetical protein
MNFTSLSASLTAAETSAQKKKSSETGNFFIFFLSSGQVKQHFHQVSRKSMTIKNHSFTIFSELYYKVAPIQKFELFKN